MTQIELNIDPLKSIGSIVDDLIEAAFVLQRQCPGVKVAETLLQHLVGAVLETTLPKVDIVHQEFTMADVPAGRKSYFLIGDTAIHATVAPNEYLIMKCRDNLTQNLRPLVITTQYGVDGAIALARDADITKRIDVLEIGQFVAANIYQWCSFQQTKCLLNIRQLIETFNHFIEKREIDPILRITVK